MRDETCPTQSIQALWKRALAEDSNQELDWLWLYTQVDTDEQRLICLQKAIHINCRNQQTRWMLEMLERELKLASVCSSHCTTSGACC